MTASSLRKASKLKCFILRIGGLSLRRDGEPRFIAMQRILCKSKAESTSAELLVQEIFSWSSRYADIRDMRHVTRCHLALPAVEGRLLCLLV
jgi:hypothetical protein